MATVRMMPANTPPMPIPTAAPADTPAEAFGGIPDAETTEVVLLSIDADDPVIEVLVAEKPEVIVKYGTRADGAGAAKVSSVGDSHLGVPLESVPQQCHKSLVEFQTTSGRGWSTMQK
jgi:hypothetical protein